MNHRTILHLIVSPSVFVVRVKVFVLQSSRLRNEARWLGDHHHDHYFLEQDDMESTSQTLRDLFQDESLKEQIFFDHHDTNALQMTTAVSRYRREMEIKLLESLIDSDDAIDELMHLWITERGNEPAFQIMEMQEECSVGLLEEEVQLRRMIQKHPRWAEPYIRLATLLFYKGITEESYQLAMYAMYLKPWHIEAPQLMVLIALREQDIAKAIYWARRGLPALSSNNRRRKQWVQLSLKQARDQIQDAERQREHYFTRETGNDVEINMQQQAWE